MRKLTDSCPANDRIRLAGGEPIALDERLVDLPHARRWAIEFGLKTADERDNLTWWLWTNRPHERCCYRYHPIQEISDEQFKKIINGEDL